MWNDTQFRNVQNKIIKYTIQEHRAPYLYYNVEIRLDFYYYLLNNMIILSSMNEDLNIKLIMMLNFIANCISCMMIIWLQQYDFCNMLCDENEKQKNSLNIVIEEKRFSWETFCRCWLDKMFSNHVGKFIQRKKYNTNFPTFLNSHIVTAVIPSLATIIYLCN